MRVSIKNTCEHSHAVACFDVLPFRCAHVRRMKAVLGRAFSISYLENVGASYRIGAVIRALALPMKKSTHVQSQV